MILIKIQQEIEPQKKKKKKTNKKKKKKKKKNIERLKRK
jgi:hypothetical protein